jgi:beta-phosphoglucomutase-like phosphatase (HAD superfamily)
MRVAAIVFDFDGVLANSEPLHLRAYQEVLAEIGVTVERDEYYGRYLGFDDVGAFKAMGLARGHDWSDRQVAALVARKTIVFDRMVASADVLYPRAVACIERLAPHFPLGIASGALRHEIETVLQSSGLDRYVRFVVASGDTPSSKPAPDPYQRAAELHGALPQACLAVEDSKWGIQSAKTAGMRCVGITHTYPSGELETADVIIESLDELTVEMIETLD